MSQKEAFDNVSLLSTLDHLSSRVHAKREPVARDEILHVVKKRLLAASPPGGLGRRCRRRRRELVDPVASL
jgi:hypothetical protein